MRQNKFICVGWEVILCDPIWQVMLYSTYCWLRGLEMEMSTAHIGHRAVRALLTIGDLTF